MEKKILGLFVLFQMVLTTGFSQLTQFEFVYNGFDLTCNPFKDEKFWISDDWKPSHGTPTFGDPFGQQSYNDGLLKATYVTGASQKGEGLFIDYSFDDSFIYDIEIQIAHQSGDAVGFSLFAANGMNEASNSSCGEDETPSVTDKIKLMETNSVFDGFPGNFKSYNKTDWAPNKDYTKLWLHSNQFFFGSTGSFLVGKVFINKKSGVDTQKPSVPSNLRVDYTTTSSAKISWNASTDNVGVVGYKVYTNGSVYTNSSQTSLTFPIECGGCINLNTYVRAFDAAGNFSNISNQVEVKTTAPSNPVYSHLPCDKLSLRATESITFEDEFHFKATENKSLSALISTSCVYESNFFRLVDEESAPIVTNTNSKSLQLNSWSAYPNPTSGNLTVKTNYLESQNELNLKIFDLMGKQVFNLADKDVLEKTYEIDLSKEPSGIYLVHVITADGVKIEKVTLSK